MTASSPSDDLDALLARVRDGDEDALGRLLLHYEPRMRTAAHVLLGPLLRPHMDSLDLVQSVHRVLLPGLRQGKYDMTHPEELIALAITVIRRKVARSWRRLRREHELQTQIREQKTLPESLHPSLTPPADPANTVQLNDVIGHLLEKLNAEERRLIELRLEGYSTSEIAARLDCDAHALRARLSRLRQRLRELGYTEWF